MRVRLTAVLGILVMGILLLGGCSGTQESMEGHLHSAWVHTSKGIRECQRGDQAMVDGETDSATKHYNKALDHFDAASVQLAKAADDANVQAGKLLDEGSKELGKASQKYDNGDMEGAEEHYGKALDKIDQALALIN